MNNPQARAYYSQVFSTLLEAYGLPDSYNFFADGLGGAPNEQPELAQQFQVMSIPTLLVMKDGKPVASSVGARPKQFIVKMIEEA